MVNLTNTGQTHRHTDTPTHEHHDSALTVKPVPDPPPTGKWEEALVCYTKALELSTEDGDKATALKNRAAVHLKQEQWEQAVKDCGAALELAPQDPKVFYRRCQALEMLEKFDLAYSDAKAVLKHDPKNKAIEPFLNRLHSKVQALINEQASTSHKVKKMMELVFTLDGGEKDTREAAADNLITLAREKVGLSPPSPPSSPSP